PTTTSTTTTTAGQTFSFMTKIGTTNCGSAGLTSPPAAPFSGEIDSDTAGTIKISDLGLGCLYIGGGSASIIPPGRIPDGETSKFSVSGGSSLGPSAGAGPADCTRGAGPGAHCGNTHAGP